jgi:GrpB-like predicted nucleotidyltransferase (UPF0157 family)
MVEAIGLERGTVRIIPYDARWPDLFEHEAALIRGLLGANVCELVHIGSTAVPGLAAKPVIDLMLATGSLRAPLSLYENLHRLGYDHRPLDTVPDRLFFAKDCEAGRTHNLSVCEADSGFWSAHLCFRDRLRTDNQLARTYVTLKYELATRYPDDRLGYTDAKDEFVARVLAGA